MNVAIARRGLRLHEFVFKTREMIDLGVVLKAVTINETVEHFLKKKK